MRLSGAGIDSARLDASLILGHVLDLDRAMLLAENTRLLTVDEIARFEALLARRLERRPLAQVLGHREFWSLDFIVTEATLDPRPDSETLVSAVLAAWPGNPPARLLDLGTGTGCLLLSLLSEWPGTWGLGLDRSPAAAHVAALNAHRLGLATRAAMVVGDWAAALGATFDVVVANPPYIPEADLAGLAPEVARFEPRTALVAGADGLDDYRRIARLLPALLAPGGLAALEVGQGQAGAVAALLSAQGLVVSGTARDLAMIERVVLAKKGLANTPISH